MSHRSSPVPVGILVSARSSRRRRKFRSLADFPSIKKDVNLPLRVGLGAVAVLSVLILGACTYSVLDAGPAPRLVTKPREDALVQLPPEPAVVQAQPAPMQPEAIVAAVADAPAAETQPLDAVAPAPKNGALAALLRHLVAKASAPAPAQPPACSNLGTEISFLHHPPDAFRQAAHENKLVLMIHLSGNFEDQAFT